MSFKIKQLPELETLRTLPKLKPLTNKTKPLQSIGALQMLLISSELMYQTMLDLDDGCDALLMSRIKTASRLIDDPNASYYPDDIKEICKRLRIKNPLQG